MNYLFGIVFFLMFIYQVVLNLNLFSSDIEILRYTTFHLQHLDKKV